MKQGKIIGLTSLIALSGIILVACGTKTSEKKTSNFQFPQMWHHLILQF
ncbi:hypothetical protein QK909_05385 [Lactococcus lactis]